MQRRILPLAQFHCASSDVEQIVLTELRSRTGESLAAVDFVLNGTPTRIEPRTGETLLDSLRTRCGIISTKDGCQPQGQCGCCLVLVDGNPKVSCAVPATAAAGRATQWREGPTWQRSVDDPTWKAVWSRFPNMAASSAPAIFLRLGRA